MSNQTVNELEKEKENAEKKLKELLFELFRTHWEDVDFGIYRIMNFKKEEVKKFIEKDLVKEVKREFKHLYEEDRKDLEKEIKNLKKKIKENLGENAINEKGELNSLFKTTKLGREYIDKLKALEDVEEVTIDKIEIFSRIYDFFSRYYVGGDLIPMRRYTRTDDYIIPYDGKEVTLYWANKNQYYVKTTEYFHKYIFRAGAYEINFKLREAHVDKNNVKGKDKFFILAHENFLEIKDKHVTIYFEYRELTEDDYKIFGFESKTNKTTIRERLIADAVERINKQLEKHANLLKQLNKPFIKSSGEKSEKTILEAHLRMYVKKNTKDYFIHKNLRKFFLTELDFYIKNEMLHINDIEGMDEANLRKLMRRVKVFRNLSTKIIKFLAQVEEFEKKLWEKKKFVLKTEYVITLDKINEYAGEEFLEKEVNPLVLDNKDQLEEWKELFGIEVKSKEDLIESNTLQGKEWKKLPIDTKHFDKEIKWKLLVALSRNNNLDEILDGVLIKSENWQALNLLSNKYQAKVQTIYIDPPFNSPSTEILYKNNYKHASWLCLMENRIHMGKRFLKKEGVFIVAIDENEQERLGMLLGGMFYNWQRTMVTILHNPRGQQGKNFSLCNEYAYFIYPDNRSEYIKNIRREEELTEELRDHGGSSLRSDAKNCFYPIIVKNNRIARIGDVPSEEYHPKARNVPLEDGSIEIWPIDNKGIERKWTYSQNSIFQILDKLLVKKKADSTLDIYRIKSKKKPRTVWTGKKYDASVHGSQLLTKMGFGGMFTFPKSLYTVFDGLYTTTDKSSTILDFFAGSGTTAHAVMKLNKEDEGKRKFILVEMADYFDTVIIPRIKKVAYSFGWKDGKPQNTDGIGVFFKYHTLEQYEDTLNNIIFVNDTTRQTKLRELFEDYIFHMLEYGTRGSTSRLNIDKFKKPFDYKMEILDNGIPKTVNVDLVETFNYLLGLRIKKIYMDNSNGKKYVWVVGERRDKSLAVVVWRDTENLDLKKDKKYIESKMREVACTEPDYIYVNEDSYVENAIPIETEFMKLMGA